MKSYISGGRVIAEALVVHGVDHAFLEHMTQRNYRAAGSLGWGFPACLGAKCARSDLPVVCFTGDGGFSYHMLELEIAPRWKINTITVVNNNRCP